MPHPDAKLPKDTRDADGERESELDYLCRRLAVLGASADEVTLVRDHWDDTEDGWTDDEKRALAGLNDTMLLAELRSVRAEYPYEEPTSTPAPAGGDGTVVMGVDDGGSQIDPEADSGSEASNGAENDPEAAESTTGPSAWVPDLNASVPALLDEVGADAEKARIVIDAETQAGLDEHREPRKTLMKALQRVAGG